MSPEIFSQLECLPWGLKLKRASIRSQGHVLLEYAGPGDSVIPGQWFADETSLTKVVQKTGQDARIVQTQSGLGVLLQPGGADRRLKALSGLARQVGYTLVVHVPERRAVLRQVCDDGVRFVKMVPVQKYAAFVERWVIGKAAAAEGFQTPELVGLDDSLGTLSMSELGEGVGGSTLYDCLDGAETEAWFARVGEALGCLHRASGLGEMSTHDAQAEAELVKGVTARAISMVACDPHQLSEMSRRVVGELQENEGALGIVHRDFYDKQIVLGSGNQLGLLDFDTSAHGEPELDIANMLVHMELRVHQGYWEKARALGAMRRFLAGYGQCGKARVLIYARATRVRLACLYALRPRWRHIPALLVEQDLVSGVVQG